MNETILTPESVKCSRCGRDVKALENRITDGANSVICSLCYAEMFYPELRMRSMEIIDRRMGFTV